VALAGAVIGVAIGAWLGSEGNNWVEGFLGRLDTGMRLLASGFDL
jgi:hypothetical protein